MTGEGKGTEIAGQDPAFAFVQSLAKDLSGGKLELPASPEIVVRVRKALSDDNVTIEQVSRVIGAEPSLAARIMNLARSAAMNPDGRPVTELRRAITRLGFNNVRSAAMSFALTQLKNASRLDAVSRQLNEIWQQSTLTAAISFYVARFHRGLDPDEALLAGLMHGIGKLYILGRAESHPELFDERGTLARVLRDWHTNVGRAILDAWKFPPAVAAAVGDHEDLDRVVSGKADLTDVVTAAVMMASFMDHRSDLELNMQGVRAFSRLGLDAESCNRVLDESRREIAILRQALGS